jgi:hypothetical protein
MHAVGRQARRKIERRNGYAPDFAAVFHGIDRRLVSFMKSMSSDTAREDRSRLQSQKFYRKINGRF